MAEYENDSYFSRKYIETSGPILGLSTPASRLAHVEPPKYPPNQPITTNFSQENVSSMVISSLDEGEIMKGLHVNDALLPSRRHLIKEVSSLVDYSDNLIVSLASLRVLAQISQLHQYEPDPNLAGVAPNRLFSILQEEPGKLEHLRINFRRRLEREETENVQFLADGKDFPNIISTWLLLNSQGEEIERILSPDFTEAFGLTNYIRLFIVNFFATNVSKKSFNLAHYILGFSQESHHEIDSNGCLSLLIDMLMYGLGHPSTECPVIFIEHPALGVKLLSFLKSLLLAPNHISSLAREYLRNDRSLFSELAASINTRLLQVSFSSDKGYTLSSEFETIRSSDFHFNVFELQQKSEIFNILAIDLHEAFSDGQEGLYLENMLKTLLSSASGTHNSTQFSGVSGESRIIDFLAAIDCVTEDAYLKRLRSQHEGEFEKALVCEFEAACTCYIESLTMLIGEIVTILLEVDDLSNERESFVESLQVWIWKFMQKSSLSVSSIESFVQLIVLIENENNCQNLNLSQDSLDAQISVLLRPEINSTIRCFLYTALMRQNTRNISQNMSEDRFLRLVELVTRDASNSTSGAVNDSLVTVALAILEFLNRARPGLLQDALFSNTTVPCSYSIPSAINSTAPFIPGILSSLTVDDSIIHSLILSSKSLIDDDLSVFLKWRAKWSLLLNLTVLEDDSGESSSNFANRFIDGGFLESVIFKFKCLTLNVSHRIETCPNLVLLAVFPIFKFLCALGISTGRQNSISSRLLSKFKNSEILDSMTILISRNNSNFDDLIQSQVVHNILILVNGVIREGGILEGGSVVGIEAVSGEGAGSVEGSSFSPSSSSTAASFRHVVINQFIKNSSWLNQIGRISNLIFNDEIYEKFITKIQIFQELLNFLSSETEMNSLKTSTTASISLNYLSIGNLIFLLKICIEKIQELIESFDILNYLIKNLNNLAFSDLEIFQISPSLKDSEKILKVLNGNYSKIFQVQNNLILLIEKILFLILKNLRIKLNSIADNSTNFYYLDSTLSQAQTARSLKIDASIVLLPIINNYNKNIRLINSNANNSLYMNTLVKDFVNLLSTNTNTMNN